jgi:hypothetical protein
MNYDRNGVLVRTSQPVRELRTVKRTILIDSRDRDLTKYAKINGGPTPAKSDPGDYVVYLPRPFENVVSVRLKSAIIAAPQTSGFVDDNSVTQNYILLGIEGLNKIDETAPSANRSGFVDNSFARISNPNISGQTLTPAANTYTIFYNDNVDEENIVRYTPPISTLDRMHITLKYHVGNYTTGGNGDITNRILNAPITFGTSENSFTFEIETLDNGFTDFSSFQTRVDAVNYVR